MCLWGVIHGRKFVNVYNVITVPTTVSGNLARLRGDPRRIALHLVAPNLALAANDFQVFAGPGDGSGNLLWVLDKYNQCKTLTIEQFGSTLLDDLVFNNTSAGNQTLYAIQTLTNESDDQLALKLYENKGYIR